MLVALFSDVHSIEHSLQALEDDWWNLRVDGQPRRLDRLWCPGDLVGYGPFPISAVKLVKDWMSAPQRWLNPAAQHVCLRGNHDDGLLRLIDQQPIDTHYELGSNAYSSSYAFRDEALEILQNHRGLMQSPAYASLVQWLRDRPVRAEPLPGYVLAHGMAVASDEDSLWVYGTSGPAIRARQMRLLREDALRTQPVRLVALGHRHVGGLWQWAGDDTVETTIIPGEWFTFENLSECPVLINCGSVSLPRPGEGSYRHPMYVLLDIDDSLERVRVQFRCIYYDTDRLIGKPDSPIGPAYPGYNTLKKQLELVTKCAAVKGEQA